MADVFISYARADQKAARRLAAALQKAGYTVWWDADLPAHRTYSEEIESRLREAQAVVVLWSREAASSQWVRAEADLGRNDDKLVQLSLDGTIPPLPFNQIQCADLTGWRGGTRHPGMSKALDSVAALVAGPSRPRAERERPGPWWKSPRGRVAAAIGALLLLVAAAVLLAPMLRGDGEKRPVVAVLPFETLGKGDEGLVAGMWEDTRQAIGRNPQLLVLGPNSAEEIAKKDIKAAAKVADYLVEANVRSSGDRIRVSANLVRTDDGSELWSKSFDRKLDDVFALQTEIAGEIEGHIRGRLAERGGKRPENIATTGEVYALYSAARAQIRKRQMGRYRDALNQLVQVVEKDPNFAPGWATLAVAKNFTSTGTSTSSPEADARRAIALAPNLAAGHAALGLALGDSPAAQASLRRALELDPNDFEALHWLANTLDERTQFKEKFELYSKVAELEPLWWPAIFNKMDMLFGSGNRAAVDRELAQVRATGDEAMIAVVTAYVLQRQGDLSGAIKAALPQLRKAPPERREMVGQFIFGPLVQLGMFDTLDEMAPQPGEYIPYLRRNDPRAIPMVEEALPPDGFWRFGPLPNVAGRVYLNNGQGPRLAGRYRAVAASPEQFARKFGPDRLGEFAAIIALALRSAGDEQQARAVLSAGERIIEGRGESEVDDVALMARIYAVQGRKGEAMSLLAQAHRKGWLPNFFIVHTDIGLDPPLAELKSDPRFESLRRQILGHLAKERAEVGEIRLD
jgi:TolB-like protein/Flp pilus assembly protein TadD